MRILIAEDESVSRRVLEATLVRFGHEVVVTRDGFEAWSVLQSEDSPSLAILDIIMPGFGGIELCHMIRRLNRPVPIYIILLTSHNTQEHLITGLDAGADDYIVKPFITNELKVHLRNSERIISLQQNLCTQAK
jgi:DNA-binding response OmpR family regulator